MDDNLKCMPRFREINKRTTQKGNVSSIVATTYSDRTAKCECGIVTYSDTGLPFFEAKPSKDADSYYCGHAGFD